MAELKMLRFLLWYLHTNQLVDQLVELKLTRVKVPLEVTRMDKIRNEYNRETAQVGRFGEKVREAKRSSFGQVPRQDGGYNTGRRMLTMELPRKRKRGWPKRKYVDAVGEDMTAVELTEEDAAERTE